MIMNLKKRLDALPGSAFSLDGIRISPIRDDYDLWYATVECRLAPGQEDYVNPAGFSIGRAYLQPEKHVPCIIWQRDIRIGYIVLRQWSNTESTSWSYYLDARHQGKGFGKTAARLAVQILKAAVPEQPIKLSAEKDNTKAHRLYRSIGFAVSHELDGDDLVFVYE
jgi:diamine N-acetyltransferase